MKDYHAILGVHPGATQEEIRRAFLRRMRAYHPDSHETGSPEWEEANRQIREINEAYDFLRGKRRKSEEKNGAREWFAEWRTICAAARQQPGAVLDLFFADVRPLELISFTGILAFLMVLYLGCCQIMGVSLQSAARNFAEAYDRNRPASVRSLPDPGAAASGPVVGGRTDRP
jgi:DnaJ-class molecular chaperone with C-terminal Zn finger domain